MYFLLIIIIGGTTNTLEFHSESIYDTCPKMQSCFNKLYLPTNPLIYLSISITLHDLDPPLSEYPSPRPVAYLRFDSVPNELNYDGFLSITSQNKYLIQESYPVFSEFVVIRLDGGLLNELHMFNAYTPRGYSYHILLEAYYCFSNTFTILPWEYQFTQYCNTSLADINAIGPGTVPSMFYVPIGTEKMTLTSNAQFSISPFNYEENMVNYTQITNPMTGWWFLISNSSNSPNLTLTLDSCTSGLCNGEELIYTSSITEYEKIPEQVDYSINSTSQILHVSFSVLESDIKYRYAFSVSAPIIPKITYGYRGINDYKLCANPKYYCKVSQNSLTTELQYLQPGVHFISLNFSETVQYNVSVFKTKLGANICHNNPYINYNEIVYSCYCSQNNAGFYCSHKAISDSLYLFSVQFLTLSNLAMIPALIYAYSQKFYVEFVGYGLNMLASYFYHYCDEEFYCFSIGFYTLLVVDFILSFNSICIGIIFISKIRNQKIKFSFMLFMMVFLMYIGVGNNFNSFVTGVLPLLMVGILPTGRYVYFIGRQSRKEGHKFWSVRVCKNFFVGFRNFRLKWLVSAFACLGVALVVRAFEGNYNYYIVKNIQTHSFWHIFVMTSAFCVLKSIYMDTDGFILDEIENQDTSIQLSSKSVESQKNLLINGIQ